MYALEQGNICHCSHYLPSSGIVVDQAGCNMPAEGDPTGKQAGGGRNRASVFQVTDFPDEEVRQLSRFMCSILALHKISGRYVALFALRPGPLWQARGGGSLGVGNMMRLDLESWTRTRLSGSFVRVRSRIGRGSCTRFGPYHTMVSLFISLLGLLNGAQNFPRTSIVSQAGDMEDRT